MKRILVLAAVFMAVAAYSDAQQVTKQLSIKFGRDAVVGPPAVNAIDGAAVWDEVMDAVCAHGGWTETVPAVNPDGTPILDAQGNPTTIQNPVNKLAFTRKTVKAFLLDHRRAYLLQTGANAGLAQAQATMKDESVEP